MANWHEITSSVRTYSGNTDAKSTTKASPATNFAGNSRACSALYRFTASRRTLSNAISTPKYDAIFALAYFFKSPPFPHAKSITRSFSRIFDCSKLDLTQLFKQRKR